MSEQTKIFITKGEQNNSGLSPEDARRMKAFFAVFFIFIGTVLLAITAYGIFHTLYASCGIIGVVMLAVGVLLGTGTSG